jgi:HEAT repeat protein/DNA-binding transcriptional ArsR family regulator
MGSMSSKNQSSWQGTLGGLVRQAESKVMPLLGPLFPERCRGVYLRSLATTSLQLPVLRGLPGATMEGGYMPLLLRSPDNGMATRNVWDALAQSSRLLICGPVGSGKSALLRSLVWEFTTRLDPTFISRLTYKLFGKASDRLLPVWVDLHEFSQDGAPLFEVMVASMARRGFPRAGKFLSQQLESGQCILFLDGFEAVRDPSREAQVARAVAQYPHNIWVVATRPTCTAPALPDFSVMLLKGMSAAGSGSFLEQYVGAHTVGTQEILAACERSSSLAQLAEMPLMLGAMGRTLRQKAVRGVRLPMLYEACLETLNEWSVEAGHRTAFALEDELRVLRHVAHSMQSHERATLDRAEMISLIAEGLPASERQHAQALWEELSEDVGILCPVSVGSQDCGFVSLALQSYLAAQDIVSRGEAASLLPMADVPWWRDTIVLASSLLSEPNAFLLRIESSCQEGPYKWFLLANCVADAESCDELLRSRVLDQLYAFLEHDASELWPAAATAIAGIARTSARDYFTALTQAQDTESRRRAALALGRLHQEWGILSLGTAIADPEPAVREQAAWALGYINSPQTLRVLPRALRSPYQGVRRAAAKSLARLGQVPELSKLVVRDLISALGDENEDVARLAEQALTEIGRAAMPQLTGILNDGRSRLPLRSRVAKALGRLGDEQALPVLIDAILSGNAEDLEGYVEAVAGVGAKAVPTLIDALRGKDTTTGASLVSALVKIGAPAVQPLIGAIAGSLPEVRNAAVRALAQIGTPAIEPLTHSLLRDERFEVRRKALEILRQIGESQVVSALVQALAEDTDPGVLANAARYLGDLGDARAVPALVDVLNSDKPLPLRTLAISSLGAIRDPRAIPALTAALDESALRDAAASALAQLGKDSVEPLIQLLHSPDSRPEAREAAWSVLREVGARARPSDANVLGLATIYGRLQNGQLSPEEILNLTQSLTWWSLGAEVHQSLVTAQALGAVCTLENIAERSAVFDWMTETTEWFRPQVRDILRGFEAVVENTKLFRTLTRRDSQRDALLSSIDKLEEIQRRTQTALLPFERALIGPVTLQWRTIILDTIKQLRGRASLNIQLLTPHLPVRAAQRTTTIVFSLFNAGDSAARNLSVTLRPAGTYGVEVLGGETHELSPLGIGEGRQVEISIAPNGVRQTELVFEARYDDDEREGVTQPFGCHIDFLEAPSTYTPIISSPYVAGVPVRTKEMFFGRQDIFSWVRDSLSGTYQENVLLLYGERRMGKTSVLYQLQRTPPTPQHVCLLFDLQLYSYIDTIQDLLFELASKIIERLEQEGVTVEEPDEEQFVANPYRAFLSFADALDTRLADHRVLVMLDEFGVLMSKVRNGVYSPAIFDFIRGVIQRTNKLGFLFTGAYEVRRMQEDYDSILFNLAKVRRISYLTPAEATELIEKPVEGLLSYHPLVIHKIITVTACHPYFIQYICDGLVQLARSESRNYVELTDLDYVIHDVVQDATGNIEKSIYDYLGEAEKLALAALANVTDDLRVFVPLSDVVGALERRGLALPRDAVMQALKALEERDLVTEMRIGQQLRYSFRMGLVRLWLRQNEMLLRLSEGRSG